MCESDITLVYKTYQNDLQWLKYSLLSVKKYLSNYKYIIIYCHDVSCGPLNKIIEEVNIKCRIIPVHYNFNGYIKQMTVKCECYGECVICHKDVDRSNTGWNCYECKQWLCHDCKYLRKKCSECSEEGENENEDEK